MNAELSIAKSHWTLIRAQIRCLSFDAKLRRLRNGLSEQHFQEIAHVIDESPLSDRQNEKLALVVGMLAKEADSLPSRERAQLDRRIGRLLRALPVKFAEPTIRSFLSDQLKHRREIGLRRIRSEPISSDFVELLWNRYRDTGDRDLLKPILSHPIPIGVLDPQKLIDSFEDDYWRMRVIEATLKADCTQAKQFARTHPIPFIWACGRLGDRRMVSVIGDCVWKATDKLPVIGIAAWAFGRFRAKKELAKLEVLLNQLADEFGVRDSELLSRRFY